MADEEELTPLEQLNVLITTREEVYIDFTQQIWDLMPHMRIGIDDFLKQESPDLYDGVRWYVKDIGVYKTSSILVGIVAEFKLGTYTINGIPTEITEENKEYYRTLLQYLFPLEMILHNDAQLIKDYLVEAVSKTKNHQPPSDDEQFDISALSEEQQIAYQLHMKANDNKQ